tara:strand:- start:8657 stop:9262 length:606 start_codon:yes stop_codon:yes gene_type:complete
MAHPSPKPRRDYDADPHDFFIEPEWCVHALLDAERFVGDVLDPACGSGTIPRVCNQRGITTRQEDIVARKGVQIVADFLAPLSPIVVLNDNIICNPPYGIAEQFIRRALQVTNHKVAMILQEKFLYSGKRHALFTETPLARIYFLSDRPSMPPGDKFLAGEIDAKGGSVNYCWMVWSQDHHGPPTAHWLRKPATIATQVAA